MNIAFKNTGMAKTFNSEKELTKKYGKQSRAIIRRMMLLQAAPSLDDVPTSPPPRRHELEGKRKGTFAVDLVHPYRLIFMPNHDPVPRKEDGGIDLRMVTSITILSVEDYH